MVSRIFASINRNWDIPNEMTACQGAAQTHYRPYYSGFLPHTQLMFKLRVPKLALYTRCGCLCWRLKYNSCSLLRFHQLILGQREISVSNVTMVSFVYTKNQV